MNHQRCRELLALQMYDEVSADEDRDLRAHLDECAACRRFGGELADGLGRLRPRVAIATVTPSTRRGWLVASLIGLVIGIAIGSRLAPGDAVPIASTAVGFERSTAPPPATSPGRLASLAGTFGR